MWISNKNNQLLNLDMVTTISISKGKTYYDDDAVQQTYSYICINGNKVAKCPNEEHAIEELRHIKESISQGQSIYEIDGVKMNVDEHGNLLD
jgi:hypothetical protein